MAGSPALIVAGCMTFAIGIGVEPASGTTAQRPCSTLISAATVQRALGVGAEDVAGPDALGDGACGWHSADASCGPRALGIEVITAREALRPKAAGDGVMVVDVDGVGDDAFSTTAIDELAMAVQLERLHLRVGGVWYRLSILGRLGESGRELLVEAAGEVAAAHAA